LVGGINIHSIDRKNGTFGFGLRIYSQYRKRGYAEEAKRILLRYCFNELRFQKYNCRCLEINKSIINHFRKTGCRFEGRRRRNIYTAGKYYDELLFGLTKEEFIKNERKITEK
jgi:RimJ/RimL family protein N-acetyltransferase